MFDKRVRPLLVVCLLLGAACVVSASLALYFGLRPYKAEPTPSGLALDDAYPPSPSIQGAYWKGAVAANGRQCAQIGATLLARNASAVEAAVGALLCEGIANPQSMGVGGGFLMTIYTRATGAVRVLNAREVAPMAADKDMFKENATLMQKGGLSVAVPGELKGYQEALEQYSSGSVTWTDIVEPTVRLCEDGIPVTAYLAEALRSSEAHIRDSPSLREILMPEGKLLQEGDVMRRVTLAKTLRALADNGSADLFYNGPLGDRFIQDLDGFGGIMTKEDLQNYTVEWSDGVSTTLSDGSRVHTVPLPGSGPLLTFILNVLDGWIPAASAPTTWQRVVEAFKFAYARRTKLGENPDYALDVAAVVEELTSAEFALNIRSKIKDDKTVNDPEYYGANAVQADNHGTAHISVLAPNGDAVAVTSTINLLLGAKIRSVQTGIIMNDEMDDFSAPGITNAYGVPPSPENFVAPGRRPLSSMCPTVVVGADGNVRLVTGAAGGTKITTATALNIIYKLWFNMTVKEAVDARRIHHQLFPMNIQYEQGFDKNILTSLEGYEHKTEEVDTASFVTAIAVDNNAPYQKIFANSDIRRLGNVAGF